MSDAAAPIDPRAQDRAARTVWARLVEPRDKRAGALIREHGHLEALARLRAGADSLGPAVAERLERHDPDAERRAADRVGARVLVPGDAEWPEGLEDLVQPPHCLWVRGGARLSTVTRRSAAVVGARTATPYGSHVAGEIAAGLASRGFTVVSGAAFGIDVAAHRAALLADGITVAALACGVDRAYPAAHAALLEEILRRGAVVSEVPLGSAPLRPRFLARNRLIAAMTSGTVVVEAGLRSGSLSTAQHALDCERPVGAVPGPVTSVASAGTNAWIREHRAELVTDAAEVAELLGVLGEDLAPIGRGPERPEDALPPAARQLWEALPLSRGAPVDRLAAAAGLTAAEVLEALGAMNLRGLAARDSGGWRKVIPRAEEPT